MKKLPLFWNTPARSVIAVGLIVLGGEFSIKLLIDFVFIPGGVLHFFWWYIDPILLVALVSTALYVLIFKPMRDQQTEIEQQFAKLHHKDQLTTLIEAIPDSIFLKDGEGRWLITNEPAKQMFQIHDLPWQGKTEMELADMQPAFRAAHEGCAAGDEKAWQAGHLLIGEERFTGEDGQCVIIETRKMPLFTEDGHRKELVVIGRDITVHAKAAAQLLESEKKYRLLFESSRDALMTLAPPSWKFASANAAALQLFGATSVAEFITLGPRDVSPERQPDGRSSAEKVQEMISTAIREGSHLFEWEHQRIGGKAFGTDVLLTRMEVEGQVTIQATVRDITRRRMAEENLRITASVFDASQEAIMIADANGSIIDVNPAFTRITGYSREEVIGKNPKILSSGLQDKVFYARMWQSLNQDGIWHGDIRNRRKSGDIYAEMLSITVIRNNYGKALRYVAIFSDITHLKEREAELSRVAHYDALTGIPNRVLLADRMMQAIAQTVRGQNMMAICYLDLDCFKPINDSLGHKAGDEVLIEIARRIENTIRGGDTVARLGGDEFVALLLGLEKGEECVSTLARLLAAISEPISVKDKFVSVSASIGVSLYPLDNEDPDTLLRHADQAMYVAKQSGKNRYHIYDTESDRRARDQHTFLKSIRHALEHDQFELHYQPKVDLSTQKLVGAEALIRWRHPERGLLLPAEFLRYVDNTDLDIEIGEWVTATALAQMDAWRKSGLNIKVSINISGYHMETSGFLEKLQQQLAAFPDLPQDSLQIEVLETVALNDIAVVRGIIESCRKIGVGFALDDFGTGYSSLSYLRNLPVEVLKIDQSFVREMLKDKGDMSIVQGIIALAGAFDCQTVAEGVETEVHYQALLNLGCDVGQGFGIAHPMPPDMLTHWQMG